LDVVSHFSLSRRRLLHRSGVVAALTASFFSFSPSVWAQSLCAGGAIATAADVTLAQNAALAAAPSGTPCPSTVPGWSATGLSIEGSNICTEITVQLVTNAYLLGLPCRVYNVHAATLTWTASTTPNVSYNVYRAAASTGPFGLAQGGSAPVNSSPIPGTACNTSQLCIWYDLSVQTSQTYYYVVTAVLNGVESAQSSPSPAATIPATVQ